MISEKNEPSLGRVWNPGNSFHPARDGSLGHLEPGHKQFPADARGSPSRIIDGHEEGEIPHHFWCLFSPSPLAAPRNEPPIKTEASTAPSGNRLGCHDDQRLFPSRPETASNYPKQPVEAAKARPWTSPFQYDKLLAQGEIFEEKSPTGTKEAKDYSQTLRQILKHDKRLYQKVSEAKRAGSFRSRMEFWQTKPSEKVFANPAVEHKKNRRPQSRRTALHASLAADIARQLSAPAAQGTAILETACLQKLKDGVMTRPD